VTEVVIADYVRSPFTLANKGALARVRPDVIAAQVVAALIERNGVKPEEIENLIVGCAFPQGEEGLNVGRLISLLAGLPQSLAGLTVDQFRGSSMQSIHMAARQIQRGVGDVFVAAGVESMSRVPLLNPLLGVNPLPNLKVAHKAVAYMGVTAENVADKWQITRAEQEAYAVRSQQRATVAAKSGRFAAEIVPIRSKTCLVEQDGCIRPETSASELAELKAAFAKEGSVTTGTSSPWTDGASAVLICSADYAIKSGLEPLARIRSAAVARCAPEFIGIGPVAASHKALEQANLDISAIDVVELDEAFASQALACVQELGIRDETLNIDGGAIALGHPVGATGARIVGKAASLLRRQGGRYALAIQCIGGGQGIATVLERI
jgi:acetyl-CoA acyltransferase